MKMIIHGHACMSIFYNEKRLVIDPWLEDGIYFNGWHHLTDPIYDDSIFDTDYIYLTHWHFDHFHEKTLERFNKKAQVFVPKFPVSYLETNLHKLGFENITEMVHTNLYTLDH
jgi:UDP-MurNAc hydroxylase